MLYENEPEITARRTAHERRLKAVCEAGDRSTNLARLSGLQRSRFRALYGPFVCRLMAKRYPPVALVSHHRERRSQCAWASSADFSGSIPIGSFRSKAGSASWIVSGSEHSAITPETKRTAATGSFAQFPFDSSTCPTGGFVQADSSTKRETLGTALSRWCTKEPTNWHARHLSRPG
jgi:hypothetical protein